MAADLILKAKSFITVDKDMSRAEAVAIDTSSGVITAVGSLADVQKSAPDAKVQDLGSNVVLPGFVDAHNHPLISGVLTRSPGHWIAPYVGFPDYEKDVKPYFRKVQAEEPKGVPQVFMGIDRSLQAVTEPTNVDLDEFFPDRPVAIVDNAGHTVYFNTAHLNSLGWADNKPPADPQGAHFGRNADGTSNGRAYESAAMIAVLGSIMAEAVPHPLLSAAKWLQYMASNGITMTSEHTYQDNMQKAFIALSSVPSVPVRLALYHVMFEDSCANDFSSPVPEALLKKNGIKVWADGSPWTGNIATSHGYLDNATTKAAGIAPGTRGEEVMNYTRDQLFQAMDAYADKGLQMSCHVNGDIAIDIVLDAYEYGLSKFNLLGTDHRWRLEHAGAARPEQFARAAQLGVSVSLGPFQFIYWGDLLDGVLFESDFGSQWPRVGDAYRDGAVVSFHNDGSATPPLPLLNIKTVVTRMTPSGKLHGPEQKVSLDVALQMQTINGAFMLKREKESGSIEVGKFADFVVLDTDPYEVDPTTIDQIKIQGTWLSGKPVDTDAYLQQIEAIDPTEHKDLGTTAVSTPHAC